MTNKNMPNEEPEIVPEQPTFDVLPLSDAVRRAVDELGYRHPTPVQTAVFESVAAGRDVVVQARTGTGKTAAFGLPTVDRLVDSQKPVVQALVLSPTRELALQIHRELASLSQYNGVTCTAVYGGAGMQPQIDAIKGGAQIVVGTPGRVLDHLERGTLRPATITALVLDESDEMLSMGFLPQMTKIMERLPEVHQTLLFSATVPPDVRRMAETRLRDPEFITLSGDHIGALSIEHYAYRSRGAKADELVQLIEIENPESAIVFCNTRDQTKRISAALCSAGYAADWLNADLAQNDREKVMRRTREGKLRFLVCTDVAARGIDISHLTHVINADFPESTENYVHRTGRTGRAGRTGTAMSLITPQDVGNLYMLRLTYKIFPVERELPRALEVQTRKETDLVTFLDQRFAAQRLTADQLSLARRVLQFENAETLVAGLLADHLAASEGALEASSQIRRETVAPAPAADKKLASGGKRAKTETKGKAEKSDKPPKKRKKDKKKHDKKPSRDEASANEVERAVVPTSSPAEQSAEPAEPMAAAAEPTFVEPKRAEPAPAGAEALQRPVASKRAPRKSSTKSSREAREEPSDAMEVVSALDLLSAQERAVLRGEAESPDSAVRPQEQEAAPTAQAPRKEQKEQRTPQPRNGRGDVAERPARGAKIFVDVGERDDVSGEDFLDTLADNGFPIAQVRFVDVLDSRTFLGVPADLLEQALDCLDGQDVGGLVVRAEQARAKKRPPRGRA